MKLNRFIFIVAVSVASFDASAAVEVLAGWHDFSAAYGQYKYASSTKATVILSSSTNSKANNGSQSFLLETGGK